MRGNERPVYISLTDFRWPVTAIASIVHRITGMLLFLGIGYLLWLLSLALASETGFDQARQTLAAPFAKLVLWGVLVNLIYHILAASTPFQHNGGFYRDSIMEGPQPLSVRWK